MKLETLLVSDRLIAVADNVDPVFGGLLRRLNTKEWDAEHDRCFDIDDKGNMSYLPKGKECVVTKSDWDPIHRQSGKIGRMLKKLPVEWENPQELEQLVHDIASFYVEPEVEIVSGDDIRKYYHYTMYAKDSGTLKESCIKHDKCQSFFKLYTDNPNQVSLAIMKSGEKIIARALLWTLASGQIFMDRVYYIDERTKNLMLRWAALNNYWVKTEQKASAECQIKKPDGKIKTENLTVNLDNWEFAEYPYLDTLQYLHPVSSSISNSRNVRKLTSTGGGYES